MQPDIPPEQLDRIAPILEELRARFHILLENLAVDTESALLFRPDHGTEQ